MYLKCEKQACSSADPDKDTGGKARVPYTYTEMVSYPFS